ncbi:MAG: carboxylating nicotinate-nucleotide diphosphorylase [Planctomycetes bacterium]|nr:carboxylating nicotinate-nucleotide diphosphorylase [Planctomycetota bacterium]
MRRSEVARLVAQALAEDVGSGDVTSEATIPFDRRAVGMIVLKRPAVICGLPLAREVFRRLGGAALAPLVKDGARARSGRAVARVTGKARSILTGERVALNFLQRLSGIATLTRAFVDAVRGTGARILDTRKTTPGCRLLERYAVRAGGGTNHRFGLFDAALIKDNHIQGAGDLEALRRAVAALRRRRGARFRIEIEAQTPEQALVFATWEVDALLLDNMSVAALRSLVPRLRRANPALTLEASGGVTLKSVRAIAATGVDWISVGALTHSAPAIDLSLDLRPC